MHVGQGQAPAGRASDLDGGTSNARDGGRLGTAARLAVVVLAGLVVFASTQRVYVQNLGLRAAIETTITIGALIVAGLLAVQFRRSRQLRDLMLFGAVMTVSVTEYPTTVLPALLRVNGRTSVTVLSVVVQSLVALAFAAAALAPSNRFVDWRVKKLVIAGVAALATLAAAQIAPFLTHVESVRAADGIGVTAHPFLLMIHLQSILLLVVAAVAFARRSDLSRGQRHLLSAAAVLLALGRVQFLALPLLAPDWVTPGMLLRVAGYAALVVFALRQHVEARQELAEAAVDAERTRIARDLHDGLAQDLAFIAAHRDRLAAELGSEHPVIVAARHALDVSRATMVDLAASSASTTADALRAVASQIASRSGAEIIVESADEDRELGPRDREEVVRIAREAMVNAVKHGDARAIIVELGAPSDDFLVRISDNGCGLPAEIPVQRLSRGGFGLPTMRARAEAIGAQLIAVRARTGGTEVRVTVP